MHPFKAILNRWRDILVYGAIAPIAAVPIGILLSQAIDALLCGIDPEFSNVATLLRYGCFSLLFAMVWWQSGTRVSHYRIIHRYPPALTAVPVSLAMVIGLALLFQPDDWRWLGGFSWRNPISASAYGTTALLLIATIIGFVITRETRDEAFASVAEARGRDLQSLSDEDLIEWLSSEAPSEDASEDMFRARERARMVFKALQTPRANKRGREIRQTAVVQGPFGAGKTTVVRYAERYAHQSCGELYIFAHVNCWGFSSLSAQEHVLEQAIDALSEHADVIALRHVPSAYADAVSESNTWFGAVFRVLGGARSPVAQLQRFTPILRAIGAQLVIVVEDTDRNGPDFDQKHIEAMLYNFREVERVSFILTAGSGSRIDFPKIAEHILFIPAIPSQTILTLLDRARSHCTANLEFIDPTATKGAPRNRPPSLCENVNFLGYHEVPQWAEACAELVATPRRLKQTLSSILARWEILHGEVDLDELIMVTVLRVCAPSLFTFFGVHFQEFKPLYEVQSQKELPERAEARKTHLEHLRSRWQQAVDECGCDPKVG